MRQLLHLPAVLDGSLWLHRNAGRIQPMHHHAELEFNLVTRGSGQYLLANRKYQIWRGDLIWLFPAQEHLLIEQSPDFEMWVAVFKPPAVRRVARDPGAAVLRENDPPGEYCRRLSKEAYGWLEELLARIAADTGQHGLFNAGLAFALLDAWRCFEGAADIPARDVHPAVEKTARLIRNDCAASSVEELARRAGLSPGRLSRLFKEQTGVALAHFRNRQRIERFLEIYGTGQRRTMIDAALEAGVGSYPQFHRVFKAMMGCSPAIHRRRQTNGQAS